MSKVVCYRAKYLLYPLALLVIGCSPTENHHLTMCQDVTKNVLAQQSIAWGKHNESKDEATLRIDLSFASPNGEAMQATCTFSADETTDQDIPGDVTYDGSPTTLAINGKEVDQKTLIQSTFKATKKVFRETAQETVKQSKEFAEKTSEKAREVTENMSEKARKAALDAATHVQQKLEH